MVRRSSEAIFTEAARNITAAKRLVFVFLFVLSFLSVIVTAATCVALARKAQRLVLIPSVFSFCGLLMCLSAEGGHAAEE